MNAATLALLVLLLIALVSVPRRHIAVVLIVAACLIPADQRTFLFTLDFTVLRILVVAAAVRLLLAGDVRPIKWTGLDKVFLAWAVSRAVIYALQWRTMAGAVNASGYFFDAVGLYWVFRQVLRSWDDARPVFTALAVCVLLMLPFVYYEHRTGDNPFAVLGRVHTAVRWQALRAQGTFPHSILLGLFWATSAPFFGAMIRARQHSILCWAAVLATISIAWLTRSSTPIMTLALTAGAFFLFPYRHYGRQIAYLAVAGVTALHIVMKAPVWHLISRISVVQGSTGYHRYRLIDAGIRHFREWAILGTRSTGHWGWGLQDVTNQYLVEGIRGGVVTLVLFLIVLIMAVRITGRYSLQTRMSQSQWLAWGVCVAVIAHSISFFGVSYFGQIHILLFLTLALAGMVQDLEASERRQVRVCVVRASAAHRQGRVGAAVSSAT